MSNMQTEIVADSPRKTRIMASLKTVVNDLTGINPENIDVHANFLEAGIDSLTLIQATQLVKEQYDVKLSVVQLLEQLSNMDALANYIDTQLPAEVITAPAKPEPPPAPVATIAPPAPAPVYVPPPQPSIPPPVVTRAPEVRSFQLPATNGSSSALDQIMSQQLQVMAQQLEMMRATYQNGNATPSPQPPPSNEPAASHKYSSNEN